MARGIPVKRKFNGKVFTFLSTTGSKKQANDIAEFRRGRGRLIRIVKVTGGFLLYDRAK